VSRPATARKPIAPRSPRRVSGPARPVALRGGAVAVPQPGRLAGIADHRWLDTLLRSRAWIWLIGLLLGGIVAMQVSLLKLNTGISRAVQSSATLERQNADLEAQVARLSSGERIRAAAADLGLVMPDTPPTYLRSRDSDAERAARRMGPPSPEAIALMQAGGRSAAVQPETTVPPAPTPTPAPEATPAPQTTPVPLPTATPEPLPAAATGGGTTAPDGQG
jgi:cell division protein FtsB